MYLVCTPKLKNSPRKIREALYGARTDATKTLQTKAGREDQLCECN